jgi:hypothetical protein
MEARNNDIGTDRRDMTPRRSKARLGLDVTCREDQRHDNGAIMKTMGRKRTMHAARPQLSPIICRHGENYDVVAEETRCINIHSLPLHGCLEQLLRRISREGRPLFAQATTTRRGATPTGPRAVMSQFQRAAGSAYSRAPGHLMTCGTRAASTCVHQKPLRACLFEPSLSRHGHK